MMRQIHANYKKEKGPFDRYFNHCVGAGRAGELLRKTAVEHMNLVSKECGFRYVRFHGLLSDDMAVYLTSRDGSVQYNWQYIDMVYDEILSAGMKPFVEVSFMPRDLASGEKSLFWWNANVTPPADYDRWYDLIHQLILHFTHRYGQQEVSTWYFEIWNEPNHPAFFSHGLDEYLKLYETTARAIKDVNASYAVGGPATAGNAWISELIQFCYDNSVPLDFLSTHTYCVDGHFDEFGEKQLMLREDQDCIMKDIAQVVAEVKNSPMPHLPIHYTEWSASYSPRDPIHDSYFHAPFILYHIKRLMGQIASLSFWTFTDVFEETGPAPTPFHGGFGLINQQTLKKPLLAFC